MFAINCLTQLSETNHPLGRGLYYSMKAYLFPGQGSQFSGMGKDLYQNNAQARALFDKANDILGFEITKVMFEGTDEELKQTNVTQPAIFLHSVILASTIESFAPDMVAGHSLGEFSALELPGLCHLKMHCDLVTKRADAMQRACELNPSTMAAVLALDDAKIEEICASVESEVVVAANFNCPGQVVISGSHEGVRLAGEKLKEAGAKRVLPLPVGGAFHSPLMSLLVKNWPPLLKIRFLQLLVVLFIKMSMHGQLPILRQSRPIYCSIDRSGSLDTIRSQHGS